MIHGSETETDGCQGIADCGTDVANARKRSDWQMIIALVGVGLLVAAYSIWKQDPDFYWATPKIIAVLLMSFSGLLALMWGVMTWSQCL